METAPNKAAKAALVEVEAVPDFDAGPAIREVAMPRDANANGDIFGGWILSLMDLGAGTIAARRAVGRVATVGIEAMKFVAPVLIGDEVSCYCQIERVGRTSIRVRVDAWARRARTGQPVKVTEGVFTFVAIDEHRHPRPLPETATNDPLVREV